MPSQSSASVGIRLQSRVTCPHCWASFSPEDVLWVSEHPDLAGDDFLGIDEQQRFLPTRFSPEGRAIDIKGVVCQHLACPKCHLSISRAFMEMEPLFVSILGAPASGKSYFLASMTWQLRKTLLERFSLSFNSADPVSNEVVNRYQDTLFMNPNEDDLVNLPKTEKEGDLYQSVSYGTRQIWYPRPFVFSIQPQKGHLSYDRSRIVSRALCLYDNAGEHFLPGGETSSHPGTQHLALSRVLLFLFDPTQHPKFRKVCDGKTNDPQMKQGRVAYSQHEILMEAARRVRDFGNLPQDAKYPRPLVVVVTKYDSWCSLLDDRRLECDQVIRRANSAMSALDIDALKWVSEQVRNVVSELAPELLAAAEGFSDDVIYIPVSAMGCGPEVLSDTGGFAIRPRDIKPQWSEIPMLYALHRAAGALVRVGQGNKAIAIPKPKLHPSEPSELERPPTPDASDMMPPATEDGLKETGT